MQKECFLFICSICCTRSIMFCTVPSDFYPVFWPFRPVFRPVTNIFLLRRKNTERISMKFTGVNHYHELIKSLHFERNRNRNEIKFESTSIGLAAMANRCWRLANEFTNSLHRLREMRSRTQFHVNLTISLIGLNINCHILTVVQHF